MDSIAWLLIDIGKPLLIIFIIVSFINILRSRWHKKSSDWINLWILFGTLAFVGLQTILLQEQFTLSQRPSIGVDLKQLDFAKENGQLKTVINKNGNISSRLLILQLQIKNHGAVAGIVKSLDLEFNQNTNPLTITSPEWKNLPLFPNQIMDLNLDRPISIDDFERIGALSKPFWVLIKLEFCNLPATSRSEKLWLKYRFDASRIPNLTLFEGGISQDMGKLLDHSLSSGKAVGFEAFKRFPEKHALLSNFFISLFASLIAILIALYIEKMRLPSLSISCGGRANVDNTYAGRGRWRFIRFRVENKRMFWPLRWVPRQTAENCRGRIEFLTENQIPIFSMQGRWASTPEIPHVSPGDIPLRVLYPDPVTIPAGNSDEFLDVIVQNEGEGQAYGWNNEAYLHNWRTPHYALRPGRYFVRASISTQNGVSFRKNFHLTVAQNFLETDLTE